MSNQELTRVSESGSRGESSAPQITQSINQYNPLPIAQMAQFVTYVDEAKKALLREGRDYQLIPGTPKPCLLKPGAEKLAAAFKLAITYELVHAIEDHKNARFAYRVRATLTHKESGATWGNCEGICTNAEKGRQTNPANTVLKMAQKRAMVGAVLNATFSSDLFNQDLDDDKEPEQVKKQELQEPKSTKEWGRLIKIAKENGWTKSHVVSLMSATANKPVENLLGEELAFFEEQFKRDPTVVLAEILGAEGAGGQ